MVTSAQYKNIITALSKIHCSFDKWENIKQKYRDAVSSNRSLERTKTLEDFIKLLEKRDIINEDNITELENIASILNRQDIIYNVIGPVQHINSVRQGFQRNPRDLHEKINYVIGRDIGYKWKEFARGLNIREGEIDLLEMRHRDVPERVREILNIFRDNCPEHVFRTNILDALCEARRKDLRNDIAAIMDNFSINH